MAEYESCWQILGISPTNDKKAIKRAYAKTLKVTKPDEKPEAFKRLHGAYEEALSYLSVEVGLLEDTNHNRFDEIAIMSDFLYDNTNNQLEESTQNKQNDTTETDFHEKNAQLNQNKSHNDQSNQEEVNQTNFVTINADSREHFLHKLKAHIENVQNRDIIELWEAFLLDELLLNIEFKQQVSFFIIKELLDLIANLNTFTSASLKGKFLQSNILHRLDDFFEWQHNFQRIEEHFDFVPELNVFFDSLTIHSDTDNAAHHRSNNEEAFSSWKYFLLVLIIITCVRHCGSHLYNQKNQSSTQNYYNEYKEFDLNGNGKLDEQEFDKIFESMSKEFSQKSQESNQPETSITEKP